MATATVPFSITEVLSPKIRHVFAEQESDFCAAVAALPVTTVTPVMSEEKAKDHCSPAG